MNKIAIYTIQNYNFGNRLQNYATQSILQVFGYEVVSLRNYSLSSYKWINRNCVLSTAYSILKKLKLKYKYLVKDKTKKNFYLFDKRYIKFSDDYIAYNDFSNDLGDKYDAIIVGSDQVWNTSFKWLSINAFLPFYIPRKISFSASFGLDSILYDKKIADCLKNFKKLSVREDAGAKIIKEFTGKDATVLVDPTMLLSSQEWRKISKKPDGAKEKYVLTYFLSLKCDAAKKLLEAVSKDRDVHELLNTDDKVASFAGPSEFLWLFDHADVILTDSFHACVFSFLFNKPFVVYDRNWNEGNMNSRLETLLKKFHLERKYVNSGLYNDIWEHDYIEGYKQLDIERKKAIEFLRDALEDKSSGQN